VRSHPSIMVRVIASWLGLRRDDGPGGFVGPWPDGSDGCCWISRIEGEEVGGWYRWSETHAYDPPDLISEFCFVGPFSSEDAAILDLARAVWMPAYNTPLSSSARARI